MGAELGRMGAYGFANDTEELDKSCVSVSFITLIGGAKAAAALCAKVNKTISVANRPADTDKMAVRGWCRPSGKLHE